MEHETRFRHAIVLADGAAPAREALDAAWPGWDAAVTTVVVADGGYRHADPLGLPVDHWVGDGDSIRADDLHELEQRGVTLERVEREKDETDAELALLAALRTGADAVSLIGVTGGPRIDHALANVALLAHPALGWTPAVIYDEHAARISLIVAPDANGAPAVRVLVGRPGDLVSLVPLSTRADGVASSGLAYALAGEPLILGRTRGVSNVRTLPEARVSVAAGRLLVIETPANLEP